jgi:hypothetical protein
MKILNKPLFFLMIPILFIQIYFTIPDSNTISYFFTDPLIIIMMVTFDLIILFLLIKLFRNTFEVKKQ